MFFVCSPDEQPPYDQRSASQGTQRIGLLGLIYSVRKARIRKALFLSRLHKKLAQSTFPKFGESKVEVELRVRRVVVYMTI